MAATNRWKNRRRRRTHTSAKCPLDEEFLVKFLRGRKYRVEEAFENIRKYFRARLEHPDIFENLLPSRIMFDAIFHQNKLLTLLKKPDSLGRRILLVKFGAWNPTVCSLNEYIRANLVVSECGLLNQMAQIAGVVGVADLDGLTMSHLLYYTPSEMKKIIKLIQECYPLRIKGVYVVNNPALFELLFAVAKLFLKPKLLKRFRIIGRDYEKLHELIPRDRLPEEYGGTLDPFDYDDYERNLRSQENYFVELAQSDLRCPSDDAFLVKFLRARKHCMEEAFGTIQKYFRVRELHRDIFQDLLPSKVMFDALVRQSKVITLLEEQDYLGRLVGILKSAPAELGAKGVIASGVIAGRTSSRRYPSSQEFGARALGRRTSTESNPGLPDHTAVHSEGRHDSLFRDLPGPPETGDARRSARE
ncbi:hypothetical protein HPB47_004515 [Ixodes persulcatus]|uniref:Uncharacterized protein n=1 Tax=Ixodes persulcatus TaxID=34615 RepID=A0AC60PFF8_IXOPE|nr:hypothetical protein HPB47_004515 [Ixodes persulcatus]